LLELWMREPEAAASRVRQVRWRPGVEGQHGHLDLIAADELHHGTGLGPSIVKKLAQLEPPLARRKKIVMRHDAPATG
jgi:hypothetical protein